MSNCGSCRGGGQTCTCYFTSECVTNDDWYVFLDGSNDTYISTPDSSAASITGSFTGIMRAAANDWTPPSNETLFAKWEEAGDQRSYRLQVNTSGGLTFSWSEDGVAVLSAVSTVPIPAVDGQYKYLSVFFDASTGDVLFFTSDQEYLSSYEQLGATVTGAGATSIFDSTAPLELGSQDVGTAGLFGGKVYYFSLSTTPLPDAQFTPDDAVGKTAGTQIPPTVVSSATSETWTLSGNSVWITDPIEFCAVTTGNGRSYAPVNFRPSNVPLPRPYGFVSRNDDQVFAASSVNAPIVFNEDETPFAGNMVDLGTSDDRLFIPEDGYYLTYGTIRTLTPGTGGDILSVRLNGLTNLVSNTGALDDCFKWVMTLVELAAGDFIQLVLTTPAGGNTTTDNLFGNFPPLFWAQWMRGL